MTSLLFQSNWASRACVRTAQIRVQKTSCLQWLRRTAASPNGRNQAFRTVSGKFVCDEVITKD